MRNTLKFNGKAFPANVGITSFVISTPDISFQTIDIPTRIGNLNYRRKIGNRAIQIACVLLGSSIEENNAILRNLYNWCYTEGPAKMVIPSMKKCFSLCECEIFPPADIARIDSEFQIAFRMHRPEFFENIESTANVGTTFTVGGTLPVYPTIVMETTETITNPVWTVDGGAYIRIKKTINQSSTIVIDCEHDVVTINGENANAYVGIDSTICQTLGTGSHVIVGSNGASGVIHWRNASLWGV